MKNIKRKYIYIIVSILVIITSFFISYGNKTESIDEILESKAYSYLSSNAKEYIKEVYNESGYLIKTEKNKEKGKPFLNPDYIEYISLPDKEKNKTDLIPPTEITEFDPTLIKTKGNYPSTYDLRNVGGDNYVTPVQNQYGGLCWAYSSTSQIESYLLLRNNKSYDRNSMVFSERHLDYALSNNGIVDDQVLYPYRGLLNDGGAAIWPWYVNADALGLAPLSWEDGMGSSTDKLEPHKVYNFNNSNLEVDKTIALPTLNMNNPNATNTAKQSYINSIKQVVSNYGGAVVSTFDPAGRCTIQSGSTRLLYSNEECRKGGAHAMQIIGWDDNYEYEMCSTGDGYSTDTARCPSSQLIRGKGAWLIKNSWGNYLSYIYLAYNSANYQVTATTKINEKEWQNVYVADVDEEYSEATVKKQLNTKERIDKIKFMINQYGMGDLYDVYVSVDNKPYEIAGTVESDYPGLYTAYVTNKNIISNTDTIKVKVKLKEESYFINLYPGETKVYTTNISKEPLIEEINYKYESKLSDKDDYEIRFTQYLKNINDGNTINYRILDTNNEEIKVNYKVSENITYVNRIYPKIIIDSTLPKGTYKLEASYNGKVLSTSNLNINSKPIKIEGKGTKEEPYLITNNAQLDLIRTVNNSHFKLMNDLDLFYDTFNEQGMFYNDGKGWNPIDYADINSPTNPTVTLDGNNHKIKGLYINRPNEDFVGLFSVLGASGKSDGLEVNIHNLTLENPMIVGNFFVGALIGNLDCGSDIYLNEIKNVSVIGGSVNARQFAGGVIGNIRAVEYYYDNEYNINGLFNSSTVIARENYAGGIIGSLEPAHAYDSKNDITLSNLMNVGKVRTPRTAGGLIGQITTDSYDPIYIENALSLGVLDAPNYGALTPEFKQGYTGTVYLKNFFYNTDKAYPVTNNNIVTKNVLRKTFNELSNINTFATFTNFNENWKYISSPNRKRLPVLKNTPFTYIKVTKPVVSLEVNTQLNLGSAIESQIDYKITPNDTSKLTVNRSNIKGIKEGYTTLTLETTLERMELPIYILNKDTYTIKFEPNTGTGTMKEFSTTLSAETTVPENTFTKKGFLFKEWNTKKDGTGISIKNKGSVVELIRQDKKELTLYAIWEPRTYTINYISNTYDNNIKTAKVNYGDNINAISNPFTLNNNEFMYWNTSPDGTGKIYKSNALLNDLTPDENDQIKLYAIWKKYNVNYYYNFNNNESLINTFTANRDTPHKIYNSSYYQVGYKLTGWSTDINANEPMYLKDTLVNLTPNITLASPGYEVNLYTVYKPITYKITYHSNTPSNETKYQEYIYDTEGKISGNQFTNNEKFIAWNTSPDGTGKTYNENASLKDIIDNNTDEINLYAIWDDGTILNTSKDYEGMYDGAYHSITPQFSTTGYNIKYSVNDRSYNLTNNPSFKEPGEYTIYYKVTKNGYKTIEGSNKIKIYGITSVENNKELIGNVIKIKDNNFYDLKQDIKVYGPNVMIVHTDKYGDPTSSSLLKTNEGIKIEIDGKLYKELKIAVTGDVSGDGKISSIDYVKIKNNIMSTPIVGESQRIAADVNNDGKISSIDYIKIKKHIMTGDSL